MRLTLGSTCHTGELIRGRTRSALVMGQLVQAVDYAPTQRGPVVDRWVSGTRPYGVLSLAGDVGAGGVCNVYQKVEIQGLDTRGGAGVDAPVYADDSTALGFGFTQPTAQGADCYVIGRVVRHGEDGSILFDFTTTQALGAASSLGANVLAQKPHHDVATPACVVVRFAGEVADGDRIVITATGADGSSVARVYECDTSPNSSLNQGADVRIDVSQAQNSAAAASGFAAAVNGDGGIAYVTSSSAVCVIHGGNVSLSASSPVNRNGAIILVRSADQSRAASPRKLVQGSAEITPAALAALNDDVNALLAAAEAPGLTLAHVTVWRRDLVISSANLAFSVAPVGPGLTGLLLQPNVASVALQAGDRVSYTLVEG